MRCNDAFEVTGICNVRVTLRRQPEVRFYVVTFMVAHCVAALLFFSVIHGELAHDPAVRGALWKLLEDAHYGHAEMEEAMFIVRGADGVLSFVRWHPSGAARLAHWNAPVPPGTIAIAHTHPNELPRPSANDVRTAMKSNLPVYVVTRMRITKTMGGMTTVVLKGEWSPG